MDPHTNSSHQHTDRLWRIVTTSLVVLVIPQRDAQTRSGLLLRQAYFFTPAFYGSLCHGCNVSSRLREVTSRICDRKNNTRRLTCEVASRILLS